MNEKSITEQQEKTVRDRDVAKQDTWEKGSRQEGRGKDVKTKVFAGILLFLALVLIGLLVDPFIHVIVFAFICSQP